MRHLKYIALSLLLVVVSCSTSRKIMVSGNPGTEILSPQMQHLGTIGIDGHLKLAIPDDSGYEFLLSRTGDDEKCIPFALDYGYHNYSGAKFCKWTGVGLCFAGMIPITAGLIALVCGAEDVAVPMLGAGGSASIIGLAMGMPADARLSQTAYEWSYKYLKDQSTNQDIVMTNVVNNGFTKRADKDDYNPKTKVNDTPKVNPEIKQKIHVKSTLSARSFTDNSKNVAGVYFGYGNLKQKGIVIENFASICVDIQQIDKKTVAIDVKESGESFFYSKMIYIVEKDSQGGYLLTLKDIPDATIKIDSQHNLVYSHSSIEIDGELYTLELQCSKQ